MCDSGESPLCTITGSSNITESKTSSGSNSSITESKTSNSRAGPHTQQQQAEGGERLSTLVKCDKMTQEKKKTSRAVMLAKKIIMRDPSVQHGIGRPSVYHAVVVIFLEFFAWGLLTTPMLTVLHETFPKHTFLMNGLIQGVKVSATFAASLVISPAIGAYLSSKYGDNLVVLVATVIAALDICFILVAVPESLPEKVRPASRGSPFSWEQADPFSSLKRVGKDTTVLLICITVFLSYLPEAGQYSSFFLYLKQVIDFSAGNLAAFIAVVGILSIIAQTVFLSILMRSIGNKNTVLLGLGFQMLQLTWYGFGSQPWMMWAAGSVAAMSSITFPAVSALVSTNADSDQQGVVQGMITGIRGLCNGLGPALYGFIFYMFHVELDATTDKTVNVQDSKVEDSIIPGPPFLFGAIIVLVAFLVALFIPEHTTSVKANNVRKHSSSLGNISTTPPIGSDEDNEPLLQDSSV
ncbi:hippocampus abundant transcript-like protein 1 isoform X3 [Rhinoraja longicauda]